MIDTVRELEIGMIRAAVIEEMRPYLDELRQEMRDCPQGLVIAMAIALGETIARHPGIRDQDRDHQLGGLIEIIRSAYAAERPR